MRIMTRGRRRKRRRRRRRRRRGRRIPGRFVWVECPPLMGKKFIMSVSLIYCKKFKLILDDIISRFDRPLTHISFFNYRLLYVKYRQEFDFSKRMENRLKSLRRKEVRAERERERERLITRRRNFFCEPLFGTMAHFLFFFYFLFLLVVSLLFSTGSY